MQSSAGIAHVTLLSFALSSSPAAALPPCPAGGMTQPPGKALALKNAAQDLRDSEEWAKAAQSFRYAADELPTCDDFDDERLRWSLWAVEAFDRSASTDEARRAMADFVVRQLEVLEARASALPDLPQLQAARDRLQPTPIRRPPPPLADPGFEDAPTSPPPRPSRTPLVLLGVGGAVLVLSVALLTPFSLRNSKLDRMLNGEGGVYAQMAAQGCGLSPTQDRIPGFAANCNTLREAREDFLAEGKVANTVVISTAVTATLGGVLAITGLALHLRQRKNSDKAAMLVGPTLGGFFIQGRF